MYVCMFVCMYACLHACMHEHVNACIYTYACNAYAYGRYFYSGKDKAFYAVLPLTSHPYS